MKDRKEFKERTSDKRNVRVKIFPVKTHPDLTLL